MADHQTPGDKLSRKLAMRSGLSRTTMEDGGSVYKGPLADKALGAVGARAMTLDETIIVGSDFDPSSAEDQALYAHERVHQMESGGMDQPNDMHDAEEMGARAVESMVLHRRATGEGFGSIMRDVASPDSRAAAMATPGSSGPGAARGEAGRLANTPEAALGAMMAGGKSYEDVVDTLARKVLQAMEEADASAMIRSTPVKSM